MSESPSVGEDLISAWREHWPYVKLSIWLFLIGSILGWLLIVLEIDLFAFIGLEELDDALPDEITTFSILVNNTIVFLLAIIGVLTFGLLTAIVLVFNGAVVGFVVVPVAQETSIGFVLVAIVPHGILELPAFFVASAVTFRLLHRFVHRVRGRRDQLLDPGDIRKIGLLLGVAWGALAIAAMIEANVTLWLIETLYPELSNTEG